MGAGRWTFNGRGIASKRISFTKRTLIHFKYTHVLFSIRTNITQEGFRRTSRLTQVLHNWIKQDRLWPYTKKLLWFPQPRNCVASIGTPNSSGHSIADKHANMSIQYVQRALLKTNNGTDKMYICEQRDRHSHPKMSPLECWRPVPYPGRDRYGGFTESTVRATSSILLVELAHLVAMVTTLPVCPKVENRHEIFTKPRTRETKIAWNGWWRAYIHQTLIFN